MKNLFIRSTRCVGVNHVSLFKQQRSHTARFHTTTHAAVSTSDPTHGSFCSCCGLFGANHTTTTNLWSRSQPNKNNLLLRRQQQQQNLVHSQRRPFITMGTDEIDGQHPHVDALLGNNQRWIEDSVKQDPNFLTKLGAPQKPRFLYIGCADSRVPANEILGLG
jgi:hypothetical protein